MKLFTQDVVERIVMDVLLSLSEQKDTPKIIASQSIDVINDPVDNAVFSGVILSKVRPSLFSEEEEHTRRTVLGILQLGYNKIINDEGKVLDFDLELELDSRLMNQFKYQDVEFLVNNTKMQYAVSQFINAFHQYERLENKYPELMKCM